MQTINNILTRTLPSVQSIYTRYIYAKDAKATQTCHSMIARDTLTAKRLESTSTKEDHMHSHRSNNCPRKKLNTRDIQIRKMTVKRETAKASSVGSTYQHMRGAGLQVSADMREKRQQIMKTRPIAVRKKKRWGAARPTPKKFKVPNAV